MKDEKKAKTMMLITKEVINMLKDIGTKRETYDDIIRRLIDTYKQNDNNKIANKN